ncbi:unnamed protein product [Meganyctiphanes norvegica]|uniref:Glycosyltransferase family 92 protein n=1 Tax=Meganyctiphanes norvegica TaxID=48144 RepID=A0AAV2RKM6_MEGNR
MNFKVKHIWCLYLQRIFKLKYLILIYIVMHGYYLYCQRYSQTSLRLFRKPLNGKIENKLFKQMIYSKHNITENLHDIKHVVKIMKEKLLVGENHDLSEKETVSLIQKGAPNLPIEFWLENKNKNLRFNKTCAKFPSILELNYNNIYWQVLETKNKTYFYVYSAHFDNRTLVKERPVVRILSMINTVKPYITTYCQLWFQGKKEPVFSKVSSTTYIWIKAWGGYHNGILQPYLLTCEIPSSLKGEIPASVSLVEHPCDLATNHLRVVNNQPEFGHKKDFAVCVKGMDFLRYDMSVILVEWLELLFLMGVHKVFIYNMETHPNNMKVLQYYQSQNKVHIIPITLPGFYPNLHDLRHYFVKKKVLFKRQTEVIPYNDCFYMNMNRYKFISLLDTDEMIMPKKSNDWIDLLKIIKEKDKTTNRRSSYVFRNVYVMDSMREPHGWNSSFPKYMKLSQNVWRSKNYTKPGAYIKAFHDTERILVLHNHFPFKCIGDGCSHFSVDTEDAHLVHYRNGCVGELNKVCPEMQRNPVKDTSIWRYLDKLVFRTRRTLTKLGFLSIYETNSEDQAVTL